MCIDPAQKSRQEAVINNNRGDVEDEVNGCKATPGRLFNEIKANFFSRKEIPKVEIIRKMLKYLHICANHGY